MTIKLKVKKKESRIISEKTCYARSYKEINFVIIVIILQYKKIIRNCCNILLLILPSITSEMSEVFQNKVILRSFTLRL